MQGSTEASTSKVTLDGTTTSSTPGRVGAVKELLKQPVALSNGHKRKQQQTWDALLRSGLAGGLAGCIAKTSVAPLDRVKILFQTGSQPFEKYSGSWTGVFQAMGQIYRENGMRGLLQGHSATLLRIFPYAGIKFMAYESLHRVLMPTPEDVTSIRLFTAGALSGLTTVLLTYPLDLIRVRLAYDRKLPTAQLGGHSALIFSVLKIYHEGDPKLRSIPATIPPLPESAHFITSASGNTSAQPYFKNPSKAIIISSNLFQRFPILKFYRGFVVSMIGMVPYAGTSFLVWGWLKSHPLFFDARRRTAQAGGASPQRAAGTISNLAYGAIAGAAAQTASYPFEVVRRRMQVGGVLRPDRFFGFWETVQFIYSRRGWRGFFVGLSIGYLKVVPLTAISFASWEGLKKLFKVQ